MINQNAYALGANRSCIRELFEYGRARSAIVGADHVYDYSLGNPSIPAPAGVNDAIREILRDTDSLLVHGYTSAAARRRSWRLSSGLWRYPAASCSPSPLIFPSISPLPRRRD